MSQNDSRHLSDRDLLDELQKAAAAERRSTAALIVLLAELDERRLFLGEGCASLFVYCTRVLRLSEHAAYGRIAAARASRRFPIILDLLEDGAITLTTVVLLAPHLTPENYEFLVEGARHKTKVGVERLIACLHPQPDIESSIRKAPISTAPSLASREPQLAPPAIVDVGPTDAVRSPAVSSRRATVAPLAPERYLIKVSVSAEAHSNLRRAQDLLRHVMPSTDPAAIIERALTTLVEQLERTKLAQVRRPRAARGLAEKSRHVAASVRRAVWDRDGGRCAFVGTAGRCTQTGFLEFHHAEPYAEGGPTTVENLSLRCRAHNAYEVQLGLDRVATGPLTDPG